MPSSKPNQQHAPEQDRRLASLVDHREPVSVLRECDELWQMLYGEAQRGDLTRVWYWTVGLYHGDIQGFGSCSTTYHDLQHATDTALALMRMIHGATRFGINVSAPHARIAVSAALLHDSGFIPEADDNVGTGAKHTRTHVGRSQKILARFGREQGWTEDAIDFGQRLIRTTDLAVQPEEVDFPEQDGAPLGRMVAAADLWAQMADRTYLEKLLFLYHELREGGIDLYEDPSDLLRKSPDFYALVERRLYHLAPVIDGFLAVHFRERYGLDHNLYRESIERQRAYLGTMIGHFGADKPAQFLKREGIVDRLKGRAKH